MTTPSDENPSTELVTREASELVATRKSEREGKKKRRMLGWLIGGGAAVVIAALVVSSITLGWFAPQPTSDAGGPIAPPNSSPAATTPGATEGGTDAENGAGAGDTTETEPDRPPVPVVETFVLTPEVAECEDDRTATVPLSFSWTTSGADRGWIGEGVSDASLEPTAEIPTSAEGWGEISYECRYSERDFTLTFQGPGGTTSYSVTVQRVLI
ncbi:hypothetical protein HDC94_000894 [Leifsonia sp. AK011]|uniref:hypothetical protein n=1 Tax=Leifsonia sp. AK011 TaxID=2723075 RepID=UPI0015CC5CA0|nr:hypothetical protein [Leifsonia sp. AK011]NYF09738.1 hypothetical protein [Leifsonia sp. AK011]